MATKNNSPMANRMRSLREEWLGVGFTNQTCRVHLADKDLLLAASYTLIADRIISILDGKSLGDPIDLAFVLANRNAMKDAVTLYDLDKWAANNKRTASTYANTLDEARTNIHKAIEAKKISENAKAYVEVKGMDADKYEEAAIFAAKEYAYKLKAQAKYLMLLSQKVIEVRNV